MGSTGKRRRKATSYVFSLGVLAVIGAGCSGGSKPAASSSTTASSAATTSSSAPPSTSSGACSLLTSDQVGAVLHESFSPGQQSSALAHNDNCLFTGSGGISDIVGIDVVSGSDAPNLLASGKSLPNMSAVSGVGSTAYVESDGRALVAQQGNVAVEVTITGFSQLDAPTLTAAAEAMAKLVFAHG